MRGCAKKLDVKSVKFKTVRQFLPVFLILIELFLGGKTMNFKTFVTCVAISGAATGLAAQSTGPDFAMSEDTIIKESMMDANGTAGTLVPIIIMFLLVLMAAAAEKGGGHYYHSY